MPNRASPRLQCREGDAGIFGQVISSAPITWNVCNAVVVRHAVEVRDVVAARLSQVALVLPAAVHLFEVLEIDLVVFQDAVVVYSTARLLLVKLVLENADLVGEGLQLLVEGGVLDGVRRRCLVLVIDALFAHGVTA